MKDEKFWSFFILHPSSFILSNQWSKPAFCPEGKANMWGPAEQLPDQQFWRSSQG